MLFQVSAGYSCAKRGQPGIYHRVARTSDWISKSINEWERGGQRPQGWPSWWGQWRGSPASLSSSLSPVKLSVKKGKSIEELWEWEFLLHLPPSPSSPPPPPLVQKDVPLNKVRLHISSHTSVLPYQSSPSAEFRKYQLSKVFSKIRLRSSNCNNGHLPLASLTSLTWLCIFCIHIRAIFFYVWKVYFATLPILGPPPVHLPVSKQTWQHTIFRQANLSAVSLFSKRILTCLENKT